MELDDGRGVSTRREDAKKDIQDAWDNVNKNPDLTDEEKAEKLEEELKKKDPNSSATYNPDTGKTDVNHGGYEGEIDKDGNITIKQPEKEEQAQVTITKEPKDVQKFIGNEATFNVQVEGKGDIKYQWYVNTQNKSVGGTLLEGETTNTYTISNIGEREDGKYYYCIVTSTLNGKTATKRTNTAKLTAVKRLTEEDITIPTKIVIAGNGNKAEIKVIIPEETKGDLSYKWYRNDTDTTTGGIEITNSNNTVLPIEKVSETNSGYYYVEITQKVGEEEHVVKS